MGLLDLTLFNFMYKLGWIIIDMSFTTYRVITHPNHLTHRTKSMKAIHYNYNSHKSLSIICVLQVKKRKVKINELPDVLIQSYSV